MPSVCSISVSVASVALTWVIRCGNSSSQVSLKCILYPNQPAHLVYVHNGPHDRKESEWSDEPVANRPCCAAVNVLLARRTAASRFGAILEQEATLLRERVPVHST